MLIDWTPLLHSSWVWLGAAFLLIGLELLVPGAFFLWIGLASLGTWMLCLCLPLTFSMKLWLFAFLSLVMTWGGKILVKRYEGAHSAPLLNQRAAQLIGQRFVLETPLYHGKGHVRVGDSPWTVKGPDAAAGSLVEVVAVEGVILEVRVVEEALHDSGR